MTDKNVYVLKTVSADMTSHGGFKWPKRGEVTCPDWRDTKSCGNGLHGLLHGNGNGELLNWNENSIWLVLSVPEKSLVNLGDKVKFPACNVVHCGTQLTATNYLAKHDRHASAIVGQTATAGTSGTAMAGNRGTATAGYRGTATAGERGTAMTGERGTATAGDFGTATAGNDGTATAGYGGTATAGYRGTATAGDYGTATAGNFGTATAGHRGTATAGNGGTATAGDFGTAKAGNDGTATAGDHGTAMAGYFGTATAGDFGTLIFLLFNIRRRVVTGYIGENGLLPNTPYHLVDGVITEK